MSKEINTKGSDKERGRAQVGKGKGQGDWNTSVGDLGKQLGKETGP
jgi:hypothetical protein